MYTLNLGRPLLTLRSLSHLTFELRVSLPFPRFPALDFFPIVQTKRSRVVLAVDAGVQDDGVQGFEWNE